MPYSILAVWYHLSDLATVVAAGVATVFYVLTAHELIVRTTVLDWYKQLSCA